MVTFLSINGLQQTVVAGTYCDDANTPLKDATVGQCNLLSEFKKKEVLHMKTAAKKSVLRQNFDFADRGFLYKV